MNAQRDGDLESISIHTPNADIKEESANKPARAKGNWSNPDNGAIFEMDWANSTQFSNSTSFSISSVDVVDGNNQQDFSENNMETSRGTNHLNMNNQTISDEETNLEWQTLSQNHTKSNSMQVPRARRCLGFRL